MIEVDGEKCMGCINRLVCAGWPGGTRDVDAEPLTKAAVAAAVVARKADVPGFQNLRQVPPLKRERPGTIHPFVLAVQGQAMPADGVLYSDVSSLLERDPALFLEK